MVTGPSFINSTIIMAPNSPVFTSLPIAELKESTKRLYKGIAVSGPAALI
jgi:hypothetical protein